jgi:DNA-binding XRE family transcriptional regulator
MSLADRVKQKRIELGLTQTEAALNAGITQQSWQSIEKETPENRVTLLA